MDINLELTYQKAYEIVHEFLEKQHNLKGWCLENELVYSSVFALKASQNDQIESKKYPNLVKEILGIIYKDSEVKMSKKMFYDVAVENHTAR